MTAVHTSLDFTLANGLRARRRLSDPAPDRKLTILRRVTKQFVSGILPRFTETNVEQSWNEQVFAAVLGYQTQFSHDQLPFHLKAKNFQRGYYSDFALGFFGVGPDRVLVSAELKGPLSSLDAPQPGTSYGGRSAVQQAFLAARQQPGCVWVVVSNFAELRLYSVKDPTTPIANVFLPDIADRLDLALLKGLLDQEALLGDARRAPELAAMTTMGHDHPGAPVAPADGQYRLIMRFTPSGAREMPLFRAEHALVMAVPNSPCLFRMFERPGYGLPLRLRSRLADGWIAVDGQNTSNGIVGRVAVSLLGQVQASFRFRAPDIRHDQTPRKQVEFAWLLNGLRFFGGVLESIYPMPSMTGPFGAELREAKGTYLAIHDSLVAPHGFNWGVAEIDDILAGDFAWDGSSDTLTNIEAVCACELAAHFRTPEGGAAANLDSVKRDIDQSNVQDSAHPP